MFSNVNTDRAWLHVCIEHVDSWPHAQSHGVAGELCERRRLWMVGRPCVRHAITGENNRASRHGDLGLAVTEVTRQSVGVSDPASMSPIDLDPVNREALWHNHVAVDGEQ